MSNARPAPPSLRGGVADEAIQSVCAALDCFVEFIIGPASGWTRWLAMTGAPLAMTGGSCTWAAASVAPPAAVRNASRFIDARLQAVSSRNMYSEHGFEARIAPEAAQVCQSLIVV